MQRNGCGDAAGLQQLPGFLQDRIEREVTWDSRVTDAYLQRVLMLLESGAADRVEPVWVARILDAQNADGGWGTSILCCTCLAARRWALARQSSMCGR